MKRIQELQTGQKEIKEETVLAQGSDIHQRLCLIKQQEATPQVSNVVVV